MKVTAEMFYKYQLQVIEENNIFLGKNKNSFLI